MPDNSLLSRTRQMLRTYGLHARKGLGQNFLVDENALQKILFAAGLTKSDTVIEVGPGLGVLTDELAKVAGKVLAVELDNQMAGILARRFSNSGHVIVKNQDILKTDLPSLLKEMATNQYKVVANLPYYITSPVIRYFLESAIKPSLLVLMTQKEVAEQITALPGTMSLLAVSVQVYAQPTLVEVIPAASFYPAPNVDSAILKIAVFPEKQVGIQDVEGFFQVVKAGFSANRKQIINPLMHRLALERSDVLALLEKSGIDFHRRAETLSIEEWKKLFEVYRTRITT